MTVCVCNFCWSSLPALARECQDCGRTVAEMEAIRAEQAAADRGWVPRRLSEAAGAAPRPAAGPKPVAPPVPATPMAGPAVYLPPVYFPGSPPAGRAGARRAPSTRPVAAGARLAPSPRARLLVVLLVSWFVGLIAGLCCMLLRLLLR